MSDSIDLPIDAVASDVVTALSQSGCVVLAAPPGAGKSTALPLRLLDAFPDRGPQLLLQPRRVAARAVAARLAAQLGESVGGRVGYQVRMDRRWDASSRIVVMTYGVLLRRLQNDPLLEAFDTVLLDEFHERSLEADLTLGMLQRLRTTVRDDLRLGVMSATLDAQPIADFLRDAPLVVSRGRAYPVDIRHAAQLDRDPMPDRVARAVRQAVYAGDGNVLAFLPGVGEIRRVESQLKLSPDVDVLPLYGDMSPEQQDRVLQPSSRRKVILATNVAETSITVEGVTAVVDSGEARVLRTDPKLGLPRLEIEPISQASAKQRAGRAGRTAPGVCYRLWAEKTHRARPEFDPPEVLRGELAAAVLALHGWGERDVLEFPWLTPPTADAVETAERTLERIGAIAEGRITPLGKRLLQLPAHPRLARLMIAGLQAGIPRLAVTCAALLSEKSPFIDSGSRRLPHDELRALGLLSADLVERTCRLHRWFDDQPDDAIVAKAAGGCHAAQRQFSGALRSLDQPAWDDSQEDSLTPEAIRERLTGCLLAAFPDRVAKRRDPGSDRGLLVGGRGVRLKDPAVPSDMRLFLCVELLQKRANAEVRRAVPVPESMLGKDLPTREEYFFHPSERRVVARRRRFWLDLVLDEQPAEVSDRTAAAEILLEQLQPHWQVVFPADDKNLQQWIGRVNFLAETLGNDQIPTIDQPRLLQVARTLAADRLSLDEIRRAPWLDYLQADLGYDLVQRIDSLAPTELEIPSGRRIPIDYSSGDTPSISVRLQELFGWQETPRIAGGKVSLLLRILAPNQREVQVTKDLANFWKVTYGEVRKELRRRYPKHEWPEDPNQGQATRSGLNATRKRSS